MSTDGQTEQWTEFWGQFIYDPVKFYCTFWSDCQIAGYQADILDSVAKNTETWVHSAHEMGKSFTASISALWWFMTRPSKIIIISANEAQLRTAMWGEINKLMRTATYNGQPFDFGLVKRDLKLLYPTEGELPDPEHFLWLRPVKVGESIHGVHLPTIQIPGSRNEIGTVFWIFEEGSSIPQEFVDIARASRHALLVVGNPTNDIGPFADECKAGPQDHPTIPGKLFRKVIHISATDSPDVKAGLLWKKSGMEGPHPRVDKNGRNIRIPGIISYDTYLERLATYTPYEIRTRLHGLFPEEEGQMMFPRSWLDVQQRLGEMIRARAADRVRRGKMSMPGRPFALGVDVAQGGGDLSAWCVWGRFGAIEIVAKNTPNTIDILTVTRELMRKYHISPAWVAFDSGGGGKQLADVLRDKGYEDILDVDFGASADDPSKYRNKRAELYGELRLAMTVDFDSENNPIGAVGHMLKVGPSKWKNPKLQCASIPPGDSILRKDLEVLPLLRDQEGRLRMLPKDKPRRETSGRGEKCLRELLGRSPDRGDACALARYAWSRGKEYAAAEEYDGDLVY